MFADEAEGLPVEVASLGTLDLGPEPALPEAVALAEELGLDLTAHRAQRLGDLREVDLVVGFERKHVTAAVVDAGAPVEKTFTLPELVDLLGGLTDPLPPDAHERVGRAHSARALDFRNRPLPEIRDPLGLPAPEQRAVAHAVEEQAARLAAALFD